jgi:hypothetical protein
MDQERRTQQHQRVIDVHGPGQLGQEQGKWTHLSSLPRERVGARPCLTDRGGWDEASSRCEHALLMPLQVLGCRWVCVVGKEQDVAQGWAVEVAAGDLVLGHGCAQAGGGVDV